MAAAALPSAQAETIQYHGEKIAVTPLAGSEWAKEHPGQLPYERCFVTAWGNNLGRTQYDYVIGGTAEDERRQAGYRLVCFSKKLGLGYMIPLELGDLTYWGLRANLPILPSFELDNSMKVDHLDGKKVSDIFGTYDGVEASISIIAGIGGHSLKNKHGVKIKNLMGKFGIGGVTLSYAKMGVAPRTEFRPYEGQSNLMLVHGTQERRMPGDWYKFELNERDPERTTFDYSIDYSEIENLEFVKIK